MQTWLENLLQSLSPPCYFKMSISASYTTKYCILNHCCCRTCFVKDCATFALANDMPVPRVTWLLVVGEGKGRWFTCLLSYSICSAASASAQCQEQKGTGAHSNSTDLYAWDLLSSPLSPSVVFHAFSHSYSRVLAWGILLREIMENITHDSQGTVFLSLDPTHMVCWVISFSPLPSPSKPISLQPSCAHNVTDFHFRYRDVTFLCLSTTWVRDDALSISFGDVETSMLRDEARSKETLIGAKRTILPTKLSHGRKGEGKFACLSPTPAPL